MRFECAFRAKIRDRGHNFRGTTKQRSTSRGRILEGAEAAEGDVYLGEAYARRHGESRRDEKAAAGTAKGGG